MPDLNNILDDIQKTTSEVDEAVQNLLAKYNDLYREGTRMFNEERTASNGSMDGLEDFYRLVQIIRRNRDVVGSLTRGMKNIRAMAQFKVIEEDIQSKPKKPPKKPPMAGAPKEKGPIGPSPEINEKNIQSLKIPEESVTTAGGNNA